MYGRVTHLYEALKSDVAQKEVKKLGFNDKAVAKGKMDEAQAEAHALHGTFPCHVNISVSCACLFDVHVPAHVKAEAHVAAALGRIRGSTDVADLAGCSVVVEAVVEDIKLKEDLYTRIGKVLQLTTYYLLLTI